MSSSDDHDHTAPLPGTGNYAGDEPALPVRLGNYMLVELLGRGAMGRVYRAEQLEPVRRTVAIKLLSTDLVDRDVLARFEAERHALARMGHPNIAQVFDAGATEARQPYFVMEYVPGETLTRYCETHRLGLEARLALFRGVVAAIQHAHQKGIIHRDIKPSNILVTERDGEAVPKVIDFGLAKALSGQLGDHTLHTHFGTLLGTPAYMSPEQAALSDEAVDTRSDIYALGLVLFELLTGDLPFGRMGDRRTTIEQMLRAIREDEPPRPSQVLAGQPRDRLSPGLDPAIRGALREDLDWIVLRCLAKQPEQRYPSAAALLADIERFLRHEPVHARRSSLGYVLSKHFRRHRLGIAISTGVVLLALVLGGGWLGTRMEAAAQAEAAQRFGQSVERLDGQLRLAHTIPLHDTTPTRERLADRLAALETELPELSGWSRGPALYALGRVSLSLDRTDDARGHLETAWREGYRAPEVAYALGLTYGRLYRDGLEALEGETNDDQRRAREAELQRQFRDPAVQYLARGRSGMAEPADFGDALIAFYEGDLPRARSLASGVADTAPWLYEARVLVGDAWRQEGNELRDAGDYEAALSAYGSARAAYRNAAAVGESDPAVHVRLCALASERLQLHLYGPAAGTAGVFEAGREACDAALKAFPGHADAYTRRARLLLMQGRLVEQEGGEPADLYTESARAGERAAELQSDGETSLLTAGSAYQRLAELQTERSGESPQEWLARAAGVYRRAMEVNPDNPDIYNELGNVHAIRGEYLEFYTSEDPMPDFRQAERYYEEAIRRRPDSPYIFNNQGILFADIASELRVGGGDPVPWFERAFESYHRAIELKADHTFAYNNLGIAYVSRARHGEEVYEDPMPWLDKAVETLEQAVALRPDYRNGWHNLGRAHLNRLQALSDRALDPRPAASNALEAFRRALDQRPTADAWLNIGNTHLALARHAVVHGGDPEPELDEAWRSYGEALAIVPNHTHALGNRWDVATERGRYLMSRGRDARPEAGRAIEGLTGLTGDFPDNFEPWEKLGDAWLLKARYELLAGHDPSASLDAAEETLARTLEINNDAAAVRLDLVDAMLLRAGWMLERGKDANGALQAAGRYLDRVAGADAAAGNRSLATATARFHATRARAMAAAGQDPSGALEGASAAAQRLRSLAPDHPESLRQTARVAYWRYRLTGRTDGLEAGLSAAESLDTARSGDAEAQRIIAVLREAAGDGEASALASERARALNPLQAGRDPLP